MKSKRFVHIGFNFEGGDPPVLEMEKTFNKAGDWIRYDAHCWILYTALDLNVWRDRIRKIPGMEEASFMLVEFDKSAGWMEKWIWEWIEERSK
jgi:hypothetical protein